MAQVLLVDDSQMVLTAMTQCLDEHQITSLQAHNGQEGYECFFKDTEIKLIISDINMPDMDGFSMIKKIAEDKGERKINILMLTTESSKSIKKGFGKIYRK